MASCRALLPRGMARLSLVLGGVLLDLLRNLAAKILRRRTRRDVGLGPPAWRSRGRPSCGRGARGGPLGAAARALLGGRRAGQERVVPDVTCGGESRFVRETYITGKKYNVLRITALKKDNRHNRNQYTLVYLSPITQIQSGVFARTRTDY